MVAIADLQRLGCQLDFLGGVDAVVVPQDGEGLHLHFSLHLGEQLDDIILVKGFFLVVLQVHKS